MLKLQLIIFSLLVCARMGEAWKGVDTDTPLPRPKAYPAPKIDPEDAAGLHYEFSKEVCPTTWNITGDCTIGLAPHGLANSGGACLAITMQAGLFRSGELNPFVDYYVYGAKVNEYTLFSSSSGGGLAMTRLSVLKDYPIPNKFSYPCYLLDARYTEVCYMHNSMGQFNDICDSEYWDVLGDFIWATYGDCFRAAGGRNAALVGLTVIYLTFVNTLPASTGEKKYTANFYVRYLKINAIYGWPLDWIIGVDLVAPSIANPKSPWNYGYSSHLPNGYDSAVPIYEGGAPLMGALLGYKVGQDWAWNMSIAEGIGQSGAIHTAVKMLPASIAANSYGATSTIDSTLKIQAITVGFVLANRLLAKGYSSNGDYWPGCQKGCPVFDVAAIDNVPLTPMLATVSKLPIVQHPAQVFVQGPASSFELWSHLMGVGHMNIYLGGGSGGNACPFPELTFCTTLTNIRKSLKTMASDAVLSAYLDASNAYQIELPQNQIITTFCGDPLEYDKFLASCKADSFCHMAVTAIPSARMQIGFTPYAITFMVSNVYLGPTGLAADFVNSYIPQSTRAIPNMRDMDKWFPAFTLSGEEKGGFGFYRPLGHSLMDYCTFVMVRSGAQIVATKTMAESLRLGTIDEYGICDYKQYEDIAKLNVENFMAFKEKLNKDAPSAIMSGTLGGIPSEAWIKKSILPNDNLVDNLPPKGFNPVATSVKW